MSVDYSLDEGINIINEGTKQRVEGNYDKAVELFKRGLTFFKEKGIEKHEAIALAYNDTALIFNEQGNAKAEDLYRKALNIGMEIFSEDNEVLGIYYSNLGECLAGKNNHSDALPYHVRAAEIKVNALGETHEEVGYEYNRIGWDFQCVGNYNKAIEFNNKCKEINIKNFGQDHTYIAISCARNAQCYTKLGEYNKALTEIEKAVKIDPAAGYYFILAECYNKLDKKDKALKYYVKVAEFRKDKLGVNHEKTLLAVNAAKEMDEALGGFGVNMPAWFDDAGDDFDF